MDMGKVAGSYSQGDMYSRAADRKRADMPEERQVHETAAQDRVKKTAVSGRTVGNARLSEKAADYYEQLKKKYSNMEFVLVAPDQIEKAKQNMASYGSSASMVVLIDTDKIEKMAEDEDFRKQYEGILNNAASQMSSIYQKLNSQFGSNAGKVKTIGMTVDDGGNASFFAVIDKSLEKQRERIEKKHEEKAEEKKKAQKEEAARRRQEKNEKVSGDVEIVKADSWEELYDKISNVLFDDMSNEVQTEAEKKVGQKVNYTV